MADDNTENECLLDSEINTLIVNQLKEYLRRYNQNVTGKKAELVLRAKGVSKLVKAGVICGKAPASQFERRQTEKVSDPAWREAPRSIFSCELGERLVANPTFYRGGLYLQLFCIKNEHKKSLRATSTTQTDMFMTVSTAQSVMCVITVL